MEPQEIVKEALDFWTAFDLDGNRQKMDNTCLELRQTKEVHREHSVPFSAPLLLPTFICMVLRTFPFPVERLRKGRESALQTPPGSLER